MSSGRLPLRLLISCPDRPGIVASVSRFLYEAEANIVRSDQYSTDPEGRVLPADGVRDGAARHASIRLSRRAARGRRRARSRGCGASADVAHGPRAPPREHHRRVLSRLTYDGDERGAEPRHRQLVAASAAGDRLGARRARPAAVRPELLTVERDPRARPRRRGEQPLDGRRCGGREVELDARRAAALVDHEHVQLPAANPHGPGAQV